MKLEWTRTRTGAAAAKGRRGTYYASPPVNRGAGKRTRYKGGWLLLAPDGAALGSYKTLRGAERAAERHEDGCIIVGQQ